jgi:multiple sugar transport system permease protein
MLGLLMFRREYYIQWNLMAVGALFLFIPTFFAFLIAQRYFVKGVVMSGLKG